MLLKRYCRLIRRIVDFFRRNMNAWVKYDEIEKWKEFKINDEIRSDKILKFLKVKTGFLLPAVDQK